MRNRGDYYGHHKGSEYKDHELKEAYECGFEEGYEEAMREIEGHHPYSRMKKY